MPRHSRSGATGRVRSRCALTRLTVDPAERKLAGRVSGILWTAGGFTLACYPLIPGVTHAHVAWNSAIAAYAMAWGLCSLLLLDWRRVHPLIIQYSTSTAMLAIFGAVASTGGSTSPAWIYLFWVGLFAAYFYERWVAAAYLLACIAVQVLPLVYDTRSLHNGFIAQLMTAGFGYISIGGAMLAGKSLMGRLRARAELLAAQQGALRRVATAVVGGEDPVRIYEIAAREASTLFQADFVAVMQVVGEGTARVMAGVIDSEVRPLDHVPLIPVTPGTDLARAVAGTSAIRTDEHAADAPARLLGAASSVIAPLLVRGETWGVIVLGSRRSATFAVSDELALVAFAELLSSAIENLDDRARLAAEAMTDPLTGLANHRALHQRLIAELAGAARHGRTVSVVMLDVDDFKEINDRAGHDAGDRALRVVAQCLRTLARAEDTLGRPGGDEFMWILPDTTCEEAEAAVDRARQLIAATLTHPIQAAISAGICDTRTTAEPAELVRLADVALYASKAQGRNRVTLYDAEVGLSLSPIERGEMIERAQALAGLQALARAIDAKDPATRGHSERVAAFVARLAQAAGWPEDRVALLREAALVHDVGKIGVPDGVLRKAGALSARERHRLLEHAELSAQIVGSVLGPEQVEWIRRHHERPDGPGYPEVLAARSIPAGAALLALADAWDVMFVGRSYSPPRSRCDALAECQSLAGRQFTEDAVAALGRLEESGELELPGVGLLAKG